MTGALPSSAGAIPVHCITCADAAEPVSIVSVDAAAGLACCTASGGEEITVQTALVGPVTVGQRLLVHAGTAIVTLAGEAAP
ncbi:HypC/HybG/HupF family hydrogenase formation chaperone [Conexibacter sp. DBS9H8]|uniref:HypC/HybG/HupF family hydrogenase formation chaperone n=1 Tax=Conexibacter sp. DBS9H8 TaxID=2937801 RepID=UPI00200E3EFB|nr:HypC/HybG/HupF family hydrogenase formation chaperone [Conexibacter sp. DBS9H8]